MKRNWIRLPLLLAGTAMLACTFGCPAPTSPAAVMAGTWKVVPGETLVPPLQNWFLTFDSNGTLTQLSYTATTGATVTWSNPPSTTTVNGEAVSISISQAGKSLTFDGTLDSATAPTVATGTLTSNLVYGGVTITVPQGSATLNKQ